MKRFGSVALALLYALPATWALQGGLDLLLPARVVAAADGKCASHGCGCDDSARTREACCCASTGGDASNASALEASRCAGAEAAVQNLLTPPALPDSIAFTLLPTARPAPEPPCLLPGRTPDASPPDKVPIL